MSHLEIFLSQYRVSEIQKSIRLGAKKFFKQDVNFEIWAKNSGLEFDRFIYSPGPIIQN